MNEKHLTREELAKRLQVPIETIRYWDKIGQAPPRIKLGHHTIRYRLVDVIAWEKSRLVGSKTA